MANTNTAARGPEIFDIHHHVGATPGVGVEAAETGSAAAMEADLTARLAYMDRFGIAQAALMPSIGTPTPNGVADRKAANDRVARYRELEPSRFPAALGTVDPADGQAALDEIDRCVEELGLRGIAWHHRFIGQAMDDLRMDPCLEKLAEHGVPAFVHIIADSTLEAVWRLEALADRFPEQQFVALDAFSSANQAHSLPHVAEKHPNIAFDTAVMVSVGHMMDRFIEMAGSDRLCLGTNFYSSPRLFRTPFPLAELKEMDLDPDTLAAVLGGNARRILGLP